MDPTPSSAVPPGPSPGPGSLTADWPKKAAAVIERAVDTVHDKAIRPLALATRAVVFGLLVLALGTVVLVLVSIGLLRLLDVYAFEGRVWLSYLVLGAGFSVIGLLAWTQRFRRTGGRAQRA